MKYGLRITMPPSPLCTSFNFPCFSVSFLIFSPDEGMGRSAKAEMICPRFPEPLPLEHPLPSLKEALEKVRGVDPSSR